MSKQGRLLARGGAGAMVLAICAVPGAVLAQSTPELARPAAPEAAQPAAADEQESQISDIVVTATKREQSLRDVPLSISGSRPGAWCS